MWVHRPLKYCGIRTCCICAVIDIQFPRQIKHTWHVTRDSFSALFLEQLMPHHTPHHVSVLVLLQTFRHWHLESFLNFPLHFLLPVEIDLFCLTQITRRSENGILYGYLLVTTGHDLYLYRPHFTLLSAALFRGHFSSLQVTWWNFSTVSIVLIHPVLLINCWCCCCCCCCSCWFIIRQCRQELQYLIHISF